MLPQDIMSLWSATTPETAYPQVEQGIFTDVAIIGAGIAGLNAAYFLLRAGFKVTVIDSNRIATGTSGNTTAKLTSQHGLIYKHLEEDVGEEKAKVYAESNEWAIGEAEEIIRREKIGCDFARLPAYLYAQTEKGRYEIEKEFEIARALELPATFHESIEHFPFPISAAVGFEDQAYFHPRKYLLALADIIQKMAGKIFENSPALDIRDEDPCLVVTPTCNISAKSVIIATNYPFQDKGLPKLLFTSRSFLLAAKTDRPIPRGMSIGIDGDKLSFRPHYTDKEEWFLLGGRAEAKENEVNEHFAFLENAARELFGIHDIGYKWASEDTMTEDRLPIIGKLPESKNIFVTTGYKKWGMTMSFVSARILTDLLKGNATAWSELYAPERLKKNRLYRYGHFALSDLSRKIAGQEKPELTDVSHLEIKPDAGKVIFHKGKRMAVYKDEQGQLHIRSATCTHLGCTVGWNEEAKTWDCPCHGSRYDRFGKVIHGPAQKSLREIDVDQEG